MIKTQMSKHAITDRLDRLAACVRYLGVGEVVLEEIHNNVRFRLTSTGLCLLYSATEEKLITGYMCSVGRCSAMYKASGAEKVPENILRTVIRNNKKYSFLTKAQTSVNTLVYVFRRKTSKFMENNC